MTHHCMSCRGRVIPADLEAKVIEAKQKVNVSITLSYECIYLLLSRTQYSEKHTYERQSLAVAKKTLLCARAARLFQ